MGNWIDSDPGDFHFLGILPGTLRLSHIWSPPILQDLALPMIGTGLLPYIRPVDENFTSLASMKYARIVLFGLTACNSATGITRFSIRRFYLLCHRLLLTLRNRW